MVVAASFVLCNSLTAKDEEQGEQFSVATLNVDGLPQRLLVLKVNPEGPGNGGTARIGKYLSRKSYDLVMTQEDFNYHDVLTAWMEDDYRMDEWSGDVEVVERKIDYLHLQNHRFGCDGLVAFWKNDLTVIPSGRTAWRQSFGKFSHANDEMVTKGFRRYEVTLRGGTRIVVYNMHMDAADEEDEITCNDAKDRMARMAQWAQLKEDVLANLDSRPVIIVGDMNSFYGRDDVKRAFIDSINESGRGTLVDAWVELQQNGEYPDFRNTETGQSSIPDGRWYAKGETLDKILYINPAVGTQIKAVAFSVDREGFVYEGKKLSDHYPVAATFEVVLPQTTGMDATSDDVGGVNDEKFYRLDGQRVSQPQKGIFIGQNGEKADIRVIK